MASIDGTTAKPSAEVQKGSTTAGLLQVVDVLLRVLLFVTALVAIIVIVTSKQTKLIPVAPGLAIPLTAKFNQLPAFIYFVAALSVACLYSIVTGGLSVLALMKPGGGLMLQFQFLIFDALVLGIVAAATGAAGGVGYIAFKGNSHARWSKVCDTYGSFCSRSAASIFLSLVSSITLLLLVWLSIYVLSKKTKTP